MAGKSDLQKDFLLKRIQNLSLPLNLLKGVGPKRAHQLARKGLHTILDLFYFIPIRYEDRSHICPIERTKQGSTALVKGKVIYGGEEKLYLSRKRLFKIIIRDIKGDLELIWFHYRKPHLDSYIKRGTELLAYGKVRINRGHRQMFHPDITTPDKSEQGYVLGFYPVYSSVKGISDNILRSLIRASLDSHLDDLIDPVPDYIIKRLHLPALEQSLRNVHFPPKKSSIELLNRLDTLSHKRLIFDRFFYVMLTIAFRKMSRKRVSKPAYLIPQNLIMDMKSFFKFSFTSDQVKAIKEIAKDLSSGEPMNRLLMGDVGTGKTVIAAAAGYISIRNNRQVALMAPTQVLAEQHMDYFSGLSEDMGFRPVILTGDRKEIERKEIYNGIKTGRYNLIIGTQSLIQKGLEFKDLGLAIIDEQHRFGVKQRNLMDKKGNNPHILVMTATPIPRTLAVTIYGDMDISLIKEYPKGHSPIVTHLIEETQRDRIFEVLKKRLSSGEQAFVVCPVIEESEERDLKSAQEMEKSLRKRLSPPFRIGIIHGRLHSHQRDKIMKDFHKGLINLLVGTTVIEVGIHAPNATVMVIAHPERFGLAQLHQLRGRVGRGTEGGICMLMVPINLPEKSLFRLKALAENLDGFEIAQRDLELRGHGEFIGIKQSGVGEIEISETIRQYNLLMKAKQEAQNLVASDPKLLSPDHQHLRIMMESISASFLDH